MKEAARKTEGFRANRCKTSRSSRSPLRGYTLNEMLIVAAIMLVLVALAWPALRKPLARHQLQAAAKQLRSEIVRTRLEAIRSGKALELRYSPGTASYRVQPAHTVEPLANSSVSRNGLARAGARPFFDDSFTSGNHLATGFADQNDEADESCITDYRLPKQISFAAVERQAETSDDLALDASWPVAASPEGLVEEEWSEPIVFYPNGRTSNAAIQLVGEHDYRIRLALRGVTGAVTVGPLERATLEPDAEAVLDKLRDLPQPALRDELRSPVLPSVATP